MDPVHGQDTLRIDSLEQVIATSSIDTLRIDAMLALGLAIYAMDPDRNWQLSKNAFADAERALQKPKLGNTERRALERLQALALNNKAVSHFIYGELDSALMLFRTAEATYARIGPAARQADALNNMGLVHGVLGESAEQGRYLRKALQVYLQEGDTVNAANARLNLGNHFNGRGMVDSAMHQFHTAMETYESLRSDQGIANCALNIGQALAEQGMPVTAMEHLLQAEVLYDALGDLRGLAVCLNNIASIQMNVGATVEALRCLHRALDLNTTLGAKAEQATNQMNIGQLLVSQGLLDLAKERFELCLSLYEEVGDEAGGTIAHGHLGDLLKKRGATEQAAYHFNEAVRIAKSLDHPRELANALYKKAHFEQDLGNRAAAMKLFQQALELDARTGDRSSESQTLSSIAALHLQLGNGTEAIERAGKALAAARATGYPKDIKRAAGVLHEALVRLGRWQEAVEMLELHHQMKDSVVNAEQAQQVLRFQLEHVFHRKQMADSLAHQAQIEELEHERQVSELRSQQARTRTWAMGAGLVVLAAGGGTIYRMDRKRRQERNERRNAQLQMRLLRAQMNPHFLFNALHGLHGYIQENERDLASAFLSKYTRLMRLVLEHSRKDEISLAEELEALDLYLGLEQIRLNGKFTFEICTGSGLVPEQVLVPPLLLQPFVENAVWHGISAKDGPGRIRIGCEGEAQHIRCSVEDDGVGMGKSPVPPSRAEGSMKTSLGATITKERLELLGQRYGAVVELRYCEVPVGTRVEITMPWIHDA